MYKDAVVTATRGLPKTVSLKLTEAEYVAVLETAKTKVWLQNVLFELVLPQQSTRFHGVNAGCTE